MHRHTPERSTLCRLIVAALATTVLLAVLGGCGDPNSGASSAHLRARTLSAISCTSDHYCLAVGARWSCLPPCSAGPLPLVQRYVDGAWSAISVTPSVAGRLLAVDCWSTAQCLAVGDTGHGVLTRRPIALLIEGTRIRYLRGLEPSTLSLSSVACLLASKCLVVASTESSSELLSWNGLHWARIQVADGQEPLAVGCNGVRICMVLGVDGHSWPYQLNRGHWRREGASKTPGSEMSAVSCAGSLTCVAVGTKGVSVMSASLAVDSYNRYRWKSLRLQGREGPSELRSVSCSSASNCVGVGDVYGDRALAVGVAGDMVRQIALPRSTTRHLGSQLDGVSCPARFFCAAVGSYLLVYHHHIVRQVLVDLWGTDR